MGAITQAALYSSWGRLCNGLWAQLLAFKQQFGVFVGFSWLQSCYPVVYGCKVWVCSWSEQGLGVYEQSLLQAANQVDEIATAGVLFWAA
jgi:hypothetical protein